MIYPAMKNENHHVLLAHFSLRDQSVQGYLCNIIGMHNRDMSSSIAGL